MAEVKAIPDEYPRISVTLCVQNARKAIELYRELFGARVDLLLETTEGRVRHAQLRVGDSLLLLSDEFPDEGVLGPLSIGGTSATMLIYVDDVDAVFAAALAAGCSPIRSVSDQFYGDRTGKFEDPFGHRWSIATHIENVSLAEIRRRAHQ